MSRRIIPHAPGASFAGTILAVGEIVYDETAEALVCGDGATPGGLPFNPYGIRADEDLALEKTLVPYTATSVLFAGDSITDGFVGNTYDAANAWRARLTARYGWTGVNLAISGGSLPDWIINLYARTIADDGIACILPGYNDQRYIGSNAAFQASYKRGLFAAAAFAAIPESRKLKGNSAAITRAGTWSASPIRSYGRLSATPGDTATFRVQGSVVYIGTIQQTGFGGRVQVSVDGLDKGTYSLDNPVGNGGAVSAINYMPMLIRIDGLDPGLHTVVATVVTKNAGSGNNNVHIEWAGSNGGMTAADTRVYLANTLRMNAAGAGGGGAYGNYTELANRQFSAISTEVANVLGADGLPVSLVDASGNYNPDDVAQIGNDNLHPSSAALSTGGHTRILNAFVGALQSLRRLGAFDARLNLLSLANTVTNSRFSYTPVLVGSGTAGANTYSVQTGEYVVINKRCFVDIRLKLATKDAAMAGSLYITLPFALATDVNAIPTFAVGNIVGATVGSGKYGIYAEVAPGTNQLLLRFVDPATEVALVPADISGTFEIRLSGSFGIL